MSRRRLLEHGASGRGEYFAHDVHPTCEQAFKVECSLPHVLHPGVTNVLHLDRPHPLTSLCPFHEDTLAEVLVNRLRTRTLKSPSPRWRSPVSDTTKG